jgi:Fe2+ transport system protein B
MIIRYIQLFKDCGSQFQIIYFIRKLVKIQIPLNQMDVPEFTEAFNLVSSDTQLVDSLTELQIEKKKIEEKIKSIKEELVILAKQKHTDILYGSKMRASIKEYMKIVYPEETKSLLIQKLKDKNLYEEYMHLNHFKLSPRIMKNEVDPEISELVRRELAQRISLSPL